MNGTEYVILLLSATDITINVAYSLGVELSVFPLIEIVLNLLKFTFARYLYITPDLAQL